MLMAFAGAGVVSVEPSDATGTVIGIFAGMLGWSFWWLATGLVVWLIRAAIHRRRAFGDVMLAPWLLATLIAFACISIPGFLLVNADQEERRLSAPSASEADVTDELSPEQEAVVDYMNGMIRCVERSTEGPRIERQFLRALENGNWPVATRRADEQHANLVAGSDCLARLRTGDDPVLNARVRTVADAMGLLASGWQTYARASERQDLAMLEVGDERVRRARRTSRQAALAVEAIYHQRDPELLARYIDFDRLVRARQRAGLD